MKKLLAIIAVLGFVFVFVSCDYFTGFRLNNDTNDTIYVSMNFINKDSSVFSMRTHTDKYIWESWYRIMPMSSFEMGWFEHPKYVKKTFRSNKLVICIFEEETLATYGTGGLMPEMALQTYVIDNFDAFDDWARSRDNGKYGIHYPPTPRMSNMEMYPPYNPPYNNP